MTAVDPVGEIVARMDAIMAAYELLCKLNIACTVENIKSMVKSTFGSDVDVSLELARFQLSMLQSVAVSRSVVKFFRKSTRSKLSTK